MSRPRLAPRARTLGLRPPRVPSLPVGRWGQRPRRDRPLPRGKAGVVGIEIALGGLRFVELQRAGPTVALRAFGEVAFGASEDLGQVLTALIEDWGVTARDVHVVNATSRANLKIQTVPTMPDSDLDAIIRGEIESEAELLGEPLVGDWSALRRGPEETEILVGKIPLRDLQTMNAACEAAGLRLQVVTSSSVILGNHLLATGHVPEGETVGLLDIGRSKMNMALITDEQIRLVREVYQGLSASFLRDRGVGDEGEEGDEGADLDLIGAGLDEVVATVQQVQRTWTQYQEHNPGTSMHHLVMTGETTRISRLLGLLQHDLRVPVLSYDPTEGIDRSSLPETYAKTASTYAVPWILATTPARSVSLNFTEGVPDLRAARATQGVAVAVLVGMLAAGGLHLTANRGLARVEEQLAATEAQKAELQAELGLLEEVRLAWEKWLDESMVLGGVPAPDLRPHLAELIRTKPPDVFLTRLAFRRGGEFWVLEADALALAPTAASGHQAMERFVGAFAGSPLVADISMRPLTYERKSGTPENLEFTIVANVRRVATGDATPIAGGEAS